MRHYFMQTTLLASMAITAVVPITTAYAQGSGLEEIVVTARRVEENLMQVPIAITAMTADSIDDRGLKSIIDLAGFTPGLFAYLGTVGNGHQDRGNRRLAFRGLSTASQAASVFIDGAPYAGSGEPFVGDVERVEVLKGPQSVYFGRSTYSGAVNYVTKTPTDHFTGRLTADFYSYGGYDGSLALSGPLIADKLGVRANIRKYHFGGQYRNGINTGERLGEQDTNAASLSFLVTPTDALKVQIYYSYTKDEDGPPPAAAIKIGTFGTSPVLNCQLGGTGGPYYCGQLPQANAMDPREISVQSTIDAYMQSELFGNARRYPVPFPVSWIDHFGIKRIAHNFHARIDYETEGQWNISSIFSYDRTKQQNLYDQQQRDIGYLPNPLRPATPGALAAACAAAPGTAANALCFTPPQNRYFLMNQSQQKDASLEVRVSSPAANRLRGTVGANIFTNLQPGGSNFGNQQSGRSTQSQSKNSVVTPAVFGGIYYDFTDALTVNLEARYQWDHIVQRQLFPTLGTRFADTFKSFSPRATVNYKITPDSMAYATFARGYRPGGFNTALQGLPAVDLAKLSTLGTNLTYAQEKLDNFEIGHKGTWLDNHLRTTVAAYYMPWRLGQVSNSQSIINAAGTNQAISVISNVGAVDLKGIELEANVALMEGLTIDGTVDYEVARYKAYVFTPDGLKIRNSTVVTGNQLDQVPQWTASLSPQYTGHLIGDWGFTTRLDYRYNSKRYIDPTNVAWIRGRHMFDYHFVANHEQSGFSIDFYVKNLFNDRTFTDAIKGNDLVYSQAAGVACPPCYTAANPAGLAGGAVLNEIRLGLPSKRTFGLKGTYNF